MTTGLTGSFADLLDAMAKLFDARAGIATKTLGTNRMGDTFYHGQANAYRDAAHECRTAAAHMRTEP